MFTKFHLLAIFSDVPPDYDYDYYAYGEYRGGYSDPYYDEYYGRGFDEYEYGYSYGPGPVPPSGPPHMNRGRGAPPDRVGLSYILLPKKNVVIVLSKKKK